MKKSYVKKILLTTMLFLFSFQILRVFLSSMMWKLLWTLGSPALLSLIALSVFALAFGSVPLRRFFGERMAFAAAGFGVILARLSLQLIHDPMASAVISSAGLVFMEWFIILLFQSDASVENGNAVSVPAFSLPAAVLADSASRTLLNGYDLAWRQSGAEVAIGVFLCVAACMLLIYTLPLYKNSRDITENTLQRALIVSMMGPWLYLSMVLLQNPAALSGLSGWSDRTAHIVLTALNAAGLIICIAGSVIPKRLRRIRGILAGAVLFLCVYAVYRRLPGTPFLACAAVLASWAAVGSILHAAAKSGHVKKGSFRTALALFTGLIAMFIMIFLHAQFFAYGALAAAAAWIALAALCASRADNSNGGHFKSSVTVAALCAICALSAVVSWALVSKNTPQSVKPAAQTLKVMTWNIHQGINQQMKMDLDAIADIIIEQKPDIVALQEVNRAQISNGCSDVLMYISRKAHMAYAYGANYSDGQYGNAVLSRYPIVSSYNKIFECNRTDPRGFLTAVIDCGGIPLRVVVTHADYVYDEPANNYYSLRKQQLGEIIHTWNKAPRTLFMGDFNAEPDSAEIKLFYAQNLRDALDEQGRKYEKTFWEGWGDPALKLDYIFTTKDIRVLRADILQSRASDHKAVTAELLIQ